MMHGTYTGNETVVARHGRTIKLKGQTALLQPSGLGGHLRAQFDNVTDLPLDLTHSWVSFPAHHWKIDESEDA